MTTPSPKDTETPALFRRYPVLEAHVPWISLTKTPTPVERLSTLEQELDVGGLWIKRDDMCGCGYGGNKPRKLEFLLAEAKAKGAKSLITLGGLGSHHTLATVACANRLGFQSSLILAQRPLSEKGKQNLLASHAMGASLSYASNDVFAGWMIALVYMRLWRRDGVRPYFVAPGGTSALGCLGYVSAAFELAEQIQRGECPEPDAIFVAMGSMGTAAGLWLGLRLAGLSTQLVPVRVYQDFRTNPFGLKWYAMASQRLLSRHIPNFEKVSLLTSEIDIIKEFIGPGYGHITTAAREAASRLSATEHIDLEYVYTGKCFAGLLEGVEQGRWSDKQIMYWHTYNSYPLQALSPTKLSLVKPPKGFEKFF